MPFPLPSFCSSGRGGEQYCSSLWNRTIKKVAWVRKPRKREPGKMIKGSRENQKSRFLKRPIFSLTKVWRSLKKILKLWNLNFWIHWEDFQWRQWKTIRNSKVAARCDKIQTPNLKIFKCLLCLPLKFYCHEIEICLALGQKPKMFGCV